MRIGIGLAAAMLLWCGTGPRAAPAADDFWSGAAKPAPTKLEPPVLPARPTLADLDAFERATAELWLRLPFGARRNLLVSRKAEAFGDYEARPSSVFKPGEALITYVEPVGYGWVPVGTDLHRLGVTVDFEITTPAGKVLGGQNGFLDYGLTSHARIRALHQPDPDARRDRGGRLRPGLHPARQGERAQRPRPAALHDQGLRARARILKQPRCAPHLRARLRSSRPLRVSASRPVPQPAR
jgi:hypothetical protein